MGQSLRYYTWYISYNKINLVLHPPFIHHLCIVLASTSFPWQNVVFTAFHRILSDKTLQISAVSLCLTASGLQPPPCFSNRYIFIQNWPCTGAGHQSALCLQPLPRCASPLCFLPLWVGPGYWIVCGFVLAGNLFSFFLSAPKSWPIYSNPIIIEAWLSRSDRWYFVKARLLLTHILLRLLRLQRHRLGAHTHTQQQHSPEIILIYEGWQFY